MTKTHEDTLDLRAVDKLINGLDGLRELTWGYDDDGGLDAPDHDLVTNVVGIVERAQTLVALVHRHAADTAGSAGTALSASQIRKIVMRTVEGES
jgi:hypothetical protein